MGRVVETERIRVLTIIDSLRVGGAEALLPTFLRHVDRTRFDVHVLSLSTVAPNHIQEAIAKSSSSLTQWQARRLLNVARIRALAREIESKNVDIVHSHLLYSNVQAALAARLARRPIVSTLHNVHQHNRFLKRKIESAVLRAANATSAGRVIWRSPVVSSSVRAVGPTNDRCAECD